MAKKIEIFTADCPLCKDTLELIRKEACVDGKITFVGKPTLGQVKQLFA